MSDFFEQQNFNSNVVTKDKEIVTDFSRIDPNITLGEFAKNKEAENRQYYDNGFNKDNRENHFASINLQDVREFDNNRQAESFVDRQFKKQEDKKALIQSMRVKIFVTVFCLVSLILAGFVIYNTVAIALLNKDVEANEEIINHDKIRIKELNKSLEEASQNSEQIAVDAMITLSVFND